MTKAEKYKLWCKNNPEKMQGYYKKYRLRNGDRIRKREREQYAASPTRQVEANRKWRAANPEKHLASVRKYRATNLNARLAHRVRGRIHQALRHTKKPGGSIALLGMSVQEYKLYIQGQLTPVCTWQNYGKIWEIDHIRPIASFPDLGDPVQQAEAFNWTNTQPLLKVENRKKGAKHAP